MPLIALPALLAVATLDVPQYPTIQLQARTNLIVNDNGFNLPPGASFNSVTVDINNAGRVTFSVSVVPGRDGPSIWYGGNGSGALTCNAENGEDVFISDPKINNANAIAFRQAFGTLNGIYTCDVASGNVTRVTAAPLGASDWGTPDVNDSGQFGYRASFTGGNAWASFASGSAAIHAADQGIDVGSPYNFLYTPSFDGLRRIAGKVRVAAAVPVPEHHEIRIFTSDGNSSLVAIDQAGSGTSTYPAFDNSVGFNDSGQVSFVVRLPASQAIVVRSNGVDSVQIARTGQGGLIGVDFFSSVVNAEGLVAFRGVDGNGQAIFVGDGTTLRRVVGKSDVIPSDLGPAQIGQNDSSPVFGGGVAINANGDVAFTAALHPPGNNQVEWGTGVYVAYAETDVLFRNGFE